MHLFALPLSAPCPPAPRLLFTICFLLNCSFVLTCKFLNFHHSFSFFIFPHFPRPPFVACNAGYAGYGSVYDGNSGCFIHYICLHIKMREMCTALPSRGREEEEELGRKEGVAWAPFCSCPSQLISAAWLSVFSIFYA